MSLGGTRTTCWPAPSRSRSSRRDRCRQSSTAQRRSVPNLAVQTSRSRWSAVVVPTVRSPSLRPRWSTATTVWVRLCASIPRITMVGSPLTEVDEGPDRSAGMPQLGGDATLLSSHADRSASVLRAAQRELATGGTEHWSEPATPSSLPSTKPSLTLTRALAAHPPHQPDRADLRRAPPAHQGHRPAARRALVPVAGVGGAGPGQPRLARPHHDPEGAASAAGPAPPTPAPAGRQGGDRPGRHRCRVTSSRSPRPKPFTPLLGHHHRRGLQPEQAR